MEKSQKKTAKKKGEAGHWERNTDAAHEACAIFPTAQAFTEASDRYFAECDATDTLYGEAGLCLALSKYNAKGKTVTLRTLRRWYDDDGNEDLQNAVQAAYLRIQAQIETDARYQEKNMCSKSMFLMKQARLGGYQDKIEQKSDTTVTILHGSTMDKSDFA